jgi:class 3 adenylate cyclase/predicted ATPase
MQCVQCRHENAADAKFCNQCAAPFAPVCAACGHENAAGAKFCNQCSTSLIALTCVSGSVQSMPQEAESERRFQALLIGVIGLLQSEKRVPYRTLKYLFSIDEALLAEVRANLSFRQLAYDEDGLGFVWIGGAPTPAFPPAVVAPSQAPPVETPTVPPTVMPPVPPLVPTTDTQTNGPSATQGDAPIETPPHESITVPEPARSAPEAERRQLTVMFCDLVGSTDLSGTLDPEDLREVVRAYQQTAAAVIDRYEGHIAQYLGDGLLIYFGFPVAHEDDAQRAIYTGLGIPEAIASLNTRLETDYGIQLAVRIGIHTGPVVVGEMGGGGRHENLALGETPNIAARLEGLAQPNTAVISPMTAQLVQRSFVLEELGPHELKGVAEPMRLYTVVRPREVGHDDDGTMRSSRFATLVGRDEEIGLLLRRWEQSQAGLGQVVMLSGEAGIGKSSLVEGLRDHVRQAGGTRIAFRCSPYHTNSALYPIIAQVQRALGWQPEDTADTQLAKLEQALADTSLPHEEAVLLLASLLSLPLPEGRYPALNVSPQQQRQQTQDMLVAWLLEEAERQPVLAVWEDLHWADPSTLETLGLMVEQAPTATMLQVLTFRPEFAPPWPSRSHLTPITLNRLGRPQVEALVHRLAGGKRLPEEVVAHIVGKTDGVPLYVEELTKMLLASDLLREETDAYVLTGPLVSVAIPDTLQDSLMARLDQMNTAKEVAQLGSVLGREFAYDMLQALYWQDEATLQAALAQLVQAELLYQRGRPPRARYLFKHALIQDAAYASLLRSVRQQYHQQVAQLLEARFPEVVATQPEVVAHHYTEAACPEPAVAYWQQAGQQAAQRSANQEAVRHLRTGLALLATLPETPARTQQELDLHMALGPVLMTTRGYAAAEVEQTYSRALALCQQLGETPQRFAALHGLWRFYNTSGRLATAREVGEQLLTLAQRQHDATRRIVAHVTLGVTSAWMGAFTAARPHFEQGSALTDPAAQRMLALRYGLAPGAQCLGYAALTLWCLGAPDQGLERSQAACTLARELEHPLSLAGALFLVARLHLLRGEAYAAQDQAEACIALSTEHTLPQLLPQGRFVLGWALAAQGQGEEGVTLMRQGVTDVRATGNRVTPPSLLAVLAEVSGTLGQVDAGLSIVTEALELVEQTGARWYEAETYRIKGTVLLHQAVPEAAQAEACFQQALAIARRQEAKSWELRAATSLARLWQAQGKRQDAYDLLAPVYEWFTEGFDTADLQEAKELLETLGRSAHAST